MEDGQIKKKVVLFLWLINQAKWAQGSKLLLKLKTFSGEEVHKVEKVEGDQTEEKDKEKSEDEGWGANNHIHFDSFLKALTSQRARIVALKKNQ